jgi:inner membrane protein
LDLLTQGLLGAALSQSVANRETARLATGVGLLAGLLADADILIRSSSDPLLNIEYHRHFTHSIFFVPFGALLAALILWPFLRNRLPARELYVYCLAGYSLSGFLDACTSYGTQLLWPLLDQRIAFNIISIVDPVFTLALLVAVVGVYMKLDRRIAWYGLGFAATYLLIGLVQLQRAEGVAMELAQQRTHQPARLLVKPTIGNLLLWRSIYEFDDRLYIDAVRVGWSSQTYAGDSVPVFRPEMGFPHLSPDSKLYRDLRRFSQFSDGYLAASRLHPGTIGDIRYAMLPNGTEPLWGIVVDPVRPEAHAEFRFFRDIGQENRHRFWGMLAGKNAPGP